MSLAACVLREPLAAWDGCDPVHWAGRSPGPAATQAVLPLGGLPSFACDERTPLAPTICFFTSPAIDCPVSELIRVTGHSGAPGTGQAGLLVGGDILSQELGDSGTAGGVFRV